MTAAADEGLLLTWLILLFAPPGVFHHAGIKIPYFAFFSHDSGIRCEEAPRNMLIAMAITAALCIGIGVFPEALYWLRPFAVDYEPYTASHVVAHLQLLVFSALAFAVLMRTGIQRGAAFVNRERQPQGLLLRTSSTRSMALWIMVMLFAYLVIYLLRYMR